jgi:hypothetical protein
MAGNQQNRRDFLKAGSAALAATTVWWNASSYAAIVGANDRVRVGVIGCGDRMKQSLIPSFLQHNKEMNFEFVAVSDLWNRRREEGMAYIEKVGGGKVDSVRNNDELYARKHIGCRCRHTRSHRNIRPTHCREKAVHQPGPQLRIAKRRGHAHDFQFGTAQRQRKGEGIVDVIADIGIDDGQLRG